MRVVDTNVLVYHLAGEPIEFSERSSALLRRLKAGVEEAHVPATAIFECIYTCQSIYDIPNRELAPLLTEIVSFSGVTTDRTDLLVEALAFWADQGPLSFAGCYHLALTQALGMTEIYTFDKKMNRYPGVERVEP